MKKITLNGWKHVPANTPVVTGFNYKLTSPAEEGYYTLYELVTKEHTHAGWEWRKEV